ncbi:MAG: hypothetical protein AB8B93_01235 [Pseudomonadales bacterium]
MHNSDSGADFDWFAVDANGAFALLASGGPGFLPPSVLEYRVMHETVAGGIEYPHWGTDAIWQDVAAMGLYVYDWSVADAAYVRVAEPAPVADQTFADMIKRITDLPELVGTFQSSERIAQALEFRITD